MPTPAHRDYAFETSAEGAVEGFSHGTHTRSSAQSHRSGVKMPCSARVCRHARASTSRSRLTRGWRELTCQA